MFAEDYCVSMAESLIPATEISEQISLAGKEASGTGNMKFMINGAVTVGTLDGANVEIMDAVGRDNIEIFGMNCSEVEDLWSKGYNSTFYYMRDEKLKRVIDALNTGFNGSDFQDIVKYLLTLGGVADPYMCLADFESYVRAQNNVIEKYGDARGFQRMSLVNIANAGIFSADRSIREYCGNIWHAEPVKVRKE